MPARDRERGKYRQTPEEARRGRGDQVGELGSGPPHSLSGLSGSPRKTRRRRV